MYDVVIQTDALLSTTTTTTHDNRLKAKRYILKYSNQSSSKDKVTNADLYATLSSSFYVINFVCPMLLSVIAIKISIHIVKIYIYSESSKAEAEIYP